MGNQPSVMTPERFKDQVFSLVLYHIASQANPNFRFALPAYCSTDNLPAPDNTDYQTLLNCYSLQDPKVVAYINKHILNKEENLAGFYQTLINHLKQTPSPNSQITSSYSSNRQPLTRSQVEKLSRNPKPHPSKKRPPITKPRPPTKTEYSAFKKGEFLDRDDQVSVHFPEATSQMDTESYNKKLDEFRKKVLDSFLGEEQSSQHTSVSEIKRRIDEELDREFADLDKVDFDNLDIDTIKSRIIEKQSQGGNYPIETNYQKPKTSPTSTKKEKPFTRCMIEDQ